MASVRAPLRLVRKPASRQSSPSSSVKLPSSSSTAQLPTLSPHSLAGPDSSPPDSPRVIPVIVPPPPPSTTKKKEKKTSNSGSTIKLHGKEIQEIPYTTKIEYQTFTAKFGKTEKEIKTVKPVLGLMLSYSTNLMSSVRNHNHQYIATKLYYRKGTDIVNKVDLLKVNAIKDKVTGEYIYTGYKYFAKNKLFRDYDEKEEGSQQEPEEGIALVNPKVEGTINMTSNGDWKFLKDGLGFASWGDIILEVKTPEQERWDSLTAD